MAALCNYDSAAKTKQQNNRAENSERKQRKRRGGVWHARHGRRRRRRRKRGALGGSVNEVVKMLSSANSAACGVEAYRPKSILVAGWQSAVIIESWRNRGIAGGINGENISLNISNLLLQL